MLENQIFRPAEVIGPLGEALTLETLPPSNTIRWVARRKAEVVAAVNGGLLTNDEACERYNLTIEEFGPAYPPASSTIAISTSARTGIEGMHCGVTAFQFRAHHFSD